MAASSTKSDAVYVLRRLRAAGFQALFAGGCVRDMLLGIKPTDYDVATDAEPRQVRRLLGHVLLVGAKFGVAMVMRKGSKVEVTTFRSDLSYSDGRHPDAVRFSSPRQDAERRDFTINGLFYDPLTDEVIDYVGGRADLKRRVIRTIGSPQQRFAEDYLRMIRAVRFAVRLKFTIAPATEAAIRRLAPKITGISGERIFDELSKMLSRPTAGLALATLRRVGLAEVILPELSRRDGHWDKAQAAVDAVASQQDVTLAFAGLLCRLEPPTIAAVLRRWGASNQLRDSLCWLAQHMDTWPGADELSLAAFKRLLANRNFPRLATLWRHLELQSTGATTIARRVAARARAIPPERITPKPLLTGRHAKKLGITEGPRMGRLLHLIYDAQLNEEFSTRQAGLAKAREIIRLESQGRR